MRLARVATFLIAFPVAASFAAADPAVVNGRASPNDCSKWNSVTQPPPTIRVLRRKSGKIEVVNFRKYVVTVMGKEWPSYLPLNVVAAGAVAVKQYAWYHAIYTSRAADGHCFDVRDGTGDQLYKPNRSRIRPDHYVALDMTWNITLRKHGKFFMTGYRRGDKVRCGRDVTGYKLFARSAVSCAARGWGWREILRKYYGPGVDIVGDGGGGLSSASPSASPNDIPNGTDPTAGTSGESDAAPARVMDPTWNAPAAPPAWANTSAPFVATAAAASPVESLGPIAAGYGHSRTADQGLAGSMAPLGLIGSSLALFGAAGPGHGWRASWMNRRRERVDVASANGRAAVTLIERDWRRDAPILTS
jgi:hypothetical protein